MTLQKWGNSLALRIPNVFASEANLKAGVRVSVSLEGDSLVIRRAPPVYSLDELLLKVTEDNIHEEISTGQPLGKEVW